MGQRATVEAGAYGGAETIASPTSGTTAPPFDPRPLPARRDSGRSLGGASVQLHEGDAAALAPASPGSPGNSTSGWLTGAAEEEEDTGAGSSLDTLDALDRAPTIRRRASLLDGAEDAAVVAGAGGEDGSTLVGLEAFGFSGIGGEDEADAVHGHHTGSAAPYAAAAPSLPNAAQQQRVPGDGDGGADSGLAGPAADLDADLTAQVALHPRGEGVLPLYSDYRRGEEELAMLLAEIERLESRIHRLRMPCEFRFLSSRIRRKVAESCPAPFIRALHGTCMQTTNPDGHTVYVRISCAVGQASRAARSGLVLSSDAAALAMARDAPHLDAALALLSHPAGARSDDLPPPPPLSPPRVAGAAAETTSGSAAELRDVEVLVRSLQALSPPLRLYAMHKHFSALPVAVRSRLLHTLLEGFEPTLQAWRADTPPPPKTLGPGTPAPPSPPAEPTPVPPAAAAAELGPGGGSTAPGQPAEAALLAPREDWGALLSTTFRARAPPQLVPLCRNSVPFTIERISREEAGPDPHQLESVLDAGEVAQQLCLYDMGPPARPPCPRDASSADDGAGGGAGRAQTVVSALCLLAARLPDLAALHRVVDVCHAAVRHRGLDPGLRTLACYHLAHMASPCRAGLDSVRPEVAASLVEVLSGCSSPEGLMTWAALCLRRSVDTALAAPSLDVAQSLLDVGGLLRGAALCAVLYEGDLQAQAEAILAAFAPDWKARRGHVADYLVEHVLPRRAAGQEPCAGACNICLNELAEAEVSVLPCFHAFHTACAREWLKRNMSCPMCRARVLDLVHRVRQAHVLA